jgi:hypothetical protein
MGAVGHGSRLSAEAVSVLCAVRPVVCVLVWLCVRDGARVRMCVRVCVRARAYVL